MRPYIEIAELSELVLEESYVLGICADPAGLRIDVEFALTRQHSAYAPPPPTENECYRRGQIRFVGMRRLVWSDQGAVPATDATGQFDYGHIDDFRWEGENYELVGEFGRIAIVARGIEVELS